MFAARVDQENLTYDHQRAAAAKPLNQPLGAKTPANKQPKTPFRKQLNDENDAFNTNFKTTKKGGNTLFVKSGKGAELDKNAFITPVAPTNRAPLGMKTTNAKGGQLKTPAPIKQSAQKTVSPRLRRTRVKIHHEEAPKMAQIEPEVPEIEYMAPRSHPLQDYPDDLLTPETLEMIKNFSSTNGRYSAHADVGSDGLTRDQRTVKNVEESAARMDEEEIRKCLENDAICGLDMGNLAKYFDEPSTKPVAIPRKVRQPLDRAPSTLSSKSAASALSRPTSAASTVSGGPRFAAPTANTAARARIPVFDRVPTSRKDAPPVAGPTRHVSGTIASRTTLGYSKGRAVSATTKQPLSSISHKPVGAQNRSVSVERSPAFIKQKNLLESLIADDPELEQLLVEKNGYDEDEPVSGLEGIDFSDVQEHLRDFQLPMPEE